MTGAPTTTVVIYPYDGQTDVSPSFSGRESPVPPLPATGMWPSSYPINVYAKNLLVTEHVLMKDGDPTPLPHTWMDSKRNAAQPGVDVHDRRRTTFLEQRALRFATLARALTCAEKSSRESLNRSG